MGLRLFHFAHAPSQFGECHKLQLGCYFPYQIIRNNGFMPRSVFLVFLIRQFGKQFADFYLCDGQSLAPFRCGPVNAS
jgi:hypothetical protein